MHPPLGLITVAALLPRDWEVRLVDLNFDRLADDEILRADMVFTGGLNNQADSLLELLARCRALGCRTVVGGPFPSSHPSWVKPVPDHLVLDEAEVTLPLFLEDLERGRPLPRYRLEQKADLSKSPVPRFELLQLRRYGTIELQFSRGCPFECEFCDTGALCGRIPRTKTPEQTLTEFQTLYDLGYRGPVYQVDDNFGANRPAARALLDKMIPWMQERGYPFLIATQTSVELADDRPFLDSMRLAGFKRVFLGLETPSFEGLRETRKMHNLRPDLLEAVHTFVEHDLEVMGGFIVGFDSDPDDIFERQFDFITRSEIPFAMTGILAALPNTPLWTRLEGEGRLLGTHSCDPFGPTNFVTRMDSTKLLEGYLRLLGSIFAPQAYFDRVLALVARLSRAGHPRLHRKAFGCFQILGMTVAAVVAQGLLSPYRGIWWRFLWRLVTTYPRQYLVGLVDSVLGHHLIRYTAEILQAKGEHPAGASGCRGGAPVFKSDGAAREAGESGLEEGVPTLMADGLDVGDPTRPRVLPGGSQ
ncbi:MAG: B12-binding domain-containing radical SAM protein [Candidatus Riflebacteria bacterium]|nr:B12-binding domain-containing radical SAM protein [Candidatus Riflebacteria bacterium]